MRLVTPFRGSILSIFIIQALLHCLPTPASAQRLIYTTYRLNQNLYEPNSELVSGYIKVIYQTRGKLLVIGTKFGFCIYDGNKFRNFTRFGEKYIGAVNDFVELEDGTLLILSNTLGILSLDKNTLRQVPLVPKTPAPRFFNFLRIPGNKLLVSGTNGIYRFKHDHFLKTAISGEQNASTFYDLENINDRILLASNGPGSAFTLFDSALHTVKTFPLKQVTYDVQADKKGNLWMATPDGLRKVSEKKLLEGELKFEAVPAPVAKAGIDSKVVLNLHADKHSNLWIGTAFGGLFRMDTLYNITQFHFANGFSFDRVNCFYEDAEDNLWLGTENALVKIPDPQITKYISNDGLQASTIHRLLHLKGEVLGITTDNLFLVDEKANRTIRRLDSLPESTDLFSTDDHIYAYSDSIFLDVQKINSKYIVHKTKLKRPENVWFKRGAAAMDDRSFLIPALKGGLYAFNGKDFRKMPGIDYTIENMFYDRAARKLWVSQLNGGLRIYNTARSLDLVLTDSSVSRNISSISAGKNGLIWISTRDKGLFQVTLENNHLKVLQHIGRAEGLSSDLCTAVLESTEGKLFTGNTSSMDIIQHVNNSYVINNLAAQLGYYNEIYSLAEDGKGNIWAGGLNGLLMLPANANLLSVSNARTFITRMQLNDSIISPTDIDEGNLLILAPHQNDITFEFASPYMKNESVVKYTYRLLRKGDTAWSKPFTNTTLALKDLPPGSFRFEVRALLPGGNESGEVGSVSFRIRSPWYWSWWFITLCILSLFSLTYAIYRYRLRQVIRLQQVRNRIASDLHDDIGSTLTNINILSSLGRRNLDEPAQAREFLNRITEEVNSSSQALDDIIWSVNTSNDGLDETAARMRRYAAELFDAGNVRYEFELDHQLAQRKLSMEQRRDFYLVFKETLNNIFKHAEARNVWINVQIEKGNLIMSVRDDGKGFDVHAETHRNGLKNLRVRVNHWNGYIQVRSSPGAGTIIVVSMPVKA
ncbi:MAG: two-component regulator propeller domain-containing protein [Chitinophagaceae bacterium]